jgi:uncharacterized protein YraI
MRFATGLVLSALLLCLSSTVFAADGYVNADVNLRAGPGTDYPAVTVIPRWTGLQVQGCVDGYSWCDVVVGSERGWIYAQYLQFVRDNNEPVYLNDNGPQLGIPVVTFTVGTYWDSYYRTRPWYRQRGYWVGRPPPIYRPLPSRPPWNRPPPRPPITRPPPPRPRPPIDSGPGGRPPVVNPPPRPRPPPGTGPGGRPPPNPGNGRPRPRDQNNVEPTPRSQTRPATQGG